MIVYFYPPGLFNPVIATTMLRHLILSICLLLASVASAQDNPVSYTHLDVYKRQLQGQVDSFDQYVILLKNTVTQMVYKHAISTIVPARMVNIETSENDAA